MARSGRSLESRAPEVTNGAAGSPGGAAAVYRLAGASLPPTAAAASCPGGSDGLRSAGGGRPGGWRVMLLVVSLVSLLGLGLGQASGQSQQRSPLPGRAAACQGDNPYLATTCYNVPMSSRPAGLAPSVVAFRESPAEGPQTALARWSDVGSVWGLAYRNAEEALYASAFHKRYVTFGPGGPGAIYRIDLSTSGVAGVTQVITVPNAGPDMHTLPLPGRDQTARDWAGKTSLGDIDFNTDESELYVVNLFDRRIYRFAMPSGTLLGSFPHGAAGEPWAEDARPFGLKFYQGRLFHGVVSSAETTQDRSDLAAYIYSSAPDGSDMRLATSFALDYPRGVALVTALIGRLPPIEEVPIDWLPWKDDYNHVAPDRAGQAVYPQPLVADIEFDQAGNMIIGLKDRQSDMTLAEQFMTNTRIEKPGLGIGDIVRARFNGTTWEVDPAELAHRDPPAPVTEFFDDFTSLADESALGGLARLMEADVVVAGTVALRDVPGRMVIPAGTWYEDPTGRRLWRQDVFCGQVPPPPVPPLRDSGRELVPARRDYRLPARLHHNEWSPAAEIGDLELLCGEEATPTPTATSSPSPTATPSPSPTGTPTRLTGTPPPTVTPTVTPTLTPTREPYRIYLPLALKQEMCKSHADVALVLDMSSSMKRDIGAGRRKYEAAVAAARAFVHLLDLTGDGQGHYDQVAVVGFNDRDWIDQELTNDRRAILAAIDRLPRQIREGTRLDLGFLAGQRALENPRHKPENLPVMIVLTDGIPNRIPFPPGSSQEQVVLEAAQRAKDRDTMVYTIGLGRPEDIVEWLLKAAASDPTSEHYYYAPSTNELEGIYRQIARLLPCPGAEPWPPRPPDTPVAREVER